MGNYHQFPRDYRPRLALPFGPGSSAFRPNFDSAPGAAGNEVESVRLVDYGRTLYRRKGTLALLAALGVAAALLVSVAEPRMYQATASLEIQGINENFLNLKEVDATATPTVSAADSYIQTQAEIIRDEALIERVVERLKLEKRPEFIARPGWLEPVLRNVFGTVQQAVPPRLYALKIARENLSVLPSRMSRIIKVRYSSRDPQLAADFVNTLAEDFIQQSLEARWNSTQRIGEWLNPQLRDLRNKLEKSEAELQAYSAASGLIFTSGKDNVAEEKLLQLQAELSKAQADRIAKQPLWELAAKASADSLSPTIDNPTVREYQVKLTDLRRQSAELSSVLQPENYKVVRVRAQIAELEVALDGEIRKIRERIGNDLEAALGREKLLAAACDRQSALVSQQNLKAIHYNDLKREVELNRQVYESMLQKVKEAGFASAVRPSNIRVVGPARPPSGAQRPNVPLNVAVGMFSGLFLGAGYVMLREQTERRLRAPGQAELFLNLPELGVIPKATHSLYGNIQGRLLGSKSGHPVPVELMTWQRRRSALSESFRATLASILFTSHDSGHPRVLVVTSPHREEGKTTVVCNLGLTLAEISRRVLLIDADMRRPRLQKVFDVGNSWGLSSLLREKNSVAELPLESLVKKTNVPNLYLLPAGPGTDNISNLLYSPRLLQLCQRFRGEFDHVIVDAPPCLQFADARILSRDADGVILVLRANHTNKAAACAAAQRLIMDGVPVLGTILNDWNPRALDDDYGYRDYRKYYSDRDASAVG